MRDIETRRSFLGKIVLGLPMIACGGVAAHAAAVKRPLKSVSLDFLRKSLKVSSRHEWTDLGPKTWLLREARSYDRLTVHHAGNRVSSETARNSVAYAIENILASHSERNYGDIGYHFIVDFAGRVWEGRSLAYEGAHVSSENVGNIGVMLLGNFEEQRASREQLSAMQGLVELLRERYRIKRHRVYGHRDLGASVCPGKYLYPHVQEIKS